MAKMTRRQYEQQMAEIARRAAALEVEIARIIDNEIVEEYEGLNDKHDALAAIEQEAKDLTNAWSTRNWTAGNWTTHSLIAQNID